MLSRILTLKPVHQTLHNLCLTSIHSKTLFFYTFFYFLKFSSKNSSVAAIKTRSSAQSNSIGKPSLNSLGKASNLMMNNTGLKTNLWCTPALTSKTLLSLPFNLTFVVATSYIDLNTDTIHSSTPRYLSAHQTTSLGTLSKMLSPSQQKLSIGLSSLPDIFLATVELLK